MERLPARERRLPSRYGVEGADARASAASVDAVRPKEVLVRNLPLPPTSVPEAEKWKDWPLWEEALDNQQQSINEHEVWWKHEALPGKPEIKKGVLLQYKATQPGTLERRTCRLVGRGNRQNPGRDIRESWADMPAATTIRCLLATAAARGWHAHHLDIRTAYLYAPMDMEAYITFPDGFKDAGEDALLLKARFGTKQAGNLWGKHIHAKLTSEGAVPSVGDRCLYTFTVGDETVYVEVHVDDLLVCDKSIQAVSHVKETVASHFKVRDAG